MKKLFFLLAFLCLSSSPSLAGSSPAAQPLKKSSVPEAAPPEKIFNAETYTLENGLQIVVIPNHRAPVITHMVWYKVGAADETTGKSGIAHFLEHLMFKGSTGLAPGEFSRKVKSLGGEDNAFTGHDYTAYFQSASLDHLETVMTMEAGRMRGLNPPLPEVESERKVILEERRQRTDNDPKARFAEQMNALAFINHPYGKPVIGWGNEIAALSWEDAKTFYDRWYAPNNAILIISGDVTGAQIRELAQKIYGGIPRADTPRRERTVSPPLAGLPELTMTDPVIREPMVQTIYRAPSARQSRKDSLALEVLQEIMSGGPTSRLYKSLVVEQKIATSAGLSYQGNAWDDGEIWVHGTPSPGKSPEEVKKALDEELRIFIKDGVTETELREAIKRMQAAAIYARDSLQGPAMIFGYALATGLTVDDIEYWTHDIGKVTREEIQDVARRTLNPDIILPHAPVTGYLLPEAEDSLESQDQIKAPAETQP